MPRPASPRLVAVLTALVPATLITMTLLLFGCGSETGAGYAVSAPAAGSASPHERADARSRMAPTGSLPGIDEEVWVITRAPAMAERGDDIPGTGALVVPGDSGEASDFVPVPLEHTDVQARIEAFVSSVVVEQRFENPFDRTIEAAYVFPLPQDAAITGFVMEIGDRRIRAVLRDRAEAEATYEAARAAGHRAALLTQERPNVFTQKVANIDPGKRIDVRITYFHVLPHEDGWYEYVFPMVVGPRFNPPGWTDGIAAASRGTGHATGQPTTVEYLTPHERSGHDIDLAVEIVGAPVAELLSPSHDIVVDDAAGVSAGDTERGLTVRLAAHDRIPNRDFRLRFRTAGEAITTALLVDRDEGGSGGHFALTIRPPAELARANRAPIEMVFVVDCSGSMSGRPLQQAKEAVEATLDRLREGDSVQVIRFNDTASAMGDRAIEVTPESKRRVRRHVEELASGGGTMMLRGIEAALGMPHDVRERRRYVVFLTDGFIGNETQILSAIHRLLGPTRLFSVGVGSAPNRYLLTRMAGAGNGTVAFLGLEEGAGELMDRFVDRIAHPALSRLAIDWNGASVREVYPERLPDLFVGRPIVITGRYDGEPPTEARISGDVRGFRVQTTAAADAAVLERPLDDRLRAPSAIASVWARRRIASLADRQTRDPGFDAAPAIRAVALEHGLLSSFTAFVAVDASERVPGGGADTPTVPTAVPVPKGVRYDATVSAGAVEERK